jgi:hypothetical protein
MTPELRQAYQDEERAAAELRQHIEDHDPEIPLLPTEEAIRTRLVHIHKDAQKSRLALEGPFIARARQFLQLQPGAARQRHSIDVGQNLPAGVRDRIATADRFLSSVWGATSRKAVKLEAKQSRHRYEYYEHGAIYLLSGSKVTDVLHELGHAVEGGRHQTGEVCREFLAYRVRDEAPRPMNEVARAHNQTPNFKGHERGRRDRFDLYFDPVSAYYVGKVYEDEHGRVTGTEILSMGLRALYEDPLRFAALDPEYCRFVIGAMGGRIK